MAVSTAVPTIAAAEAIPSTSPTSSAGVAGQLAELLAEVLELEQVGVDAHFFDELGADSLTMAKFCARVRKRPDLPKVAMKDIYRDPTIAALAAHAWCGRGRGPGRTDPH